MKKYIKKIVKSITSLRFRNNLRFLPIALKNYYEDLMLYRKYSTVFEINSVENTEGKMIIDYHAIEKGMLHTNMKPAFAKDRIVRLHEYLSAKEIIHQLLASNSQVIVAYQVLCKYYELHQKKNIDIEDFYTYEQYNNYKKLLKIKYQDNFSGIIEYAKDDFYKYNESCFPEFAFSRKSVRNFTGELVDVELLKKIVQLALTAPSVCNRQASKVYLVEDKKKIDKILKIQGGFSGYTENVNQLLILTNDRSYYYTIGERNQFYVDGGIFLMNLLYSLHYYRIANCPANWGKEVTAEKELAKVISIPESEKIICMIPIGMASNLIRTTLSQRRIANEVFKILN